MSELSELIDALKSAVDLLPKLDRLIIAIEDERKQTTGPEALTRSKLNGQVYAGTVTLVGGAGDWSYSNDFTVEYASVFYIDSHSQGPYVFSSGAMGESTGAGTYTSFDEGGDSARIPIIGNHLSVTSKSESDRAPQLFLAVFTDVGRINSSS